MARLFIVLVTLVLGEEEKQGCQLLQTAAERRKPGGPNAGADLLPLKDVVESSGEDGWCVFGAKGVWASNCAVSRQTRDIDTFVKTWELDYLMVMNMPSPPYTLKLPDQRTLTIRDHNYPLDDLYCFANGWYSNSDSQREEFFKNFSYLEEVSEKSCNELQKKVPGFNKLSMKDMAEESDYDNHFLLDLAKKGGNLALSSDRVMTNMGLGHVSFEFFEEVDEEEVSEYQPPTLDPELVVPIITSLSPLEGQEGSWSSLGIIGDGFVAGCQCAFISEDPEDWEVERAQLSEATVLSSMLIHCSAPDETVAVAVYCPPVLSSNYMWMRRPVAASATWWPKLNYTHMYPEYNLTYRTGVRIQDVQPRAYIPYVESQSTQKYFVILEVTGFSLEKCEVRFGDVPAVTMVMNSSSIEAIVPAASDNSSVPLHLFCGEELKQAAAGKRPRAANRKLT
ncbi:Uncharacterized protein SCF082_LOCUS22362 [Durusdinium trenchii]|uniref:Uncharacterized protein n=1 Tax=Durusdinium trenchii TaxID=1381693 RepID=A0ABP0LFW9_9DINO